MDSLVLWILLLFSRSTIPVTAYRTTINSRRGCLSSCRPYLYYTKERHNNLPTSSHSQKRALQWQAYSTPPMSTPLEEPYNKSKKDRKFLHPVSQFLITIALYVFHLTCLTQHQVAFPFQLIPNQKGHFCSIGWDSIAGLLTLVAYRVVRRQRRRKRVQPPFVEENDASLPSLLSNPTMDEAPWKLPKENRRLALTSVLCVAALVQGYLWTGRLSIFWEDAIFTLSGLGFYITAPMQRSLCVLAGHLSWVLIGTALLKWVPRPPKFFATSNNTQQHTEGEDNSTGTTTSTKNTTAHESMFRWFQSQIAHSNWVWWTVGGYYVSSWLFNIADGLNQYLLPPQVLLDAQESIVSQLVNPEHNDVAASIVGYVAPCISAPWWEEILYRGFCLPIVTQCLGYPVAVFVQGLIFSAHHMSLTAALPLAVLGWTWAILYTKSRNLWTVIFVHALWNSRVFLGSWLGL